MLMSGKDHRLGGPFQTIAAPYESSSESSGLGMLDLWALVT